MIRPRTLSIAVCIAALTVALLLFAGLNQAAFAAAFAAGMNAFISCF